MIEFSIVCDWVYLSRIFGRGVIKFWGMMRSLLGEEMEGILGVDMK